MNKKQLYKQLINSNAIASVTLRIQKFKVNTLLNAFEKWCVILCFSIQIHQYCRHPSSNLHLSPRQGWATSWENLFMPYANNKSADPRSLITAFILYLLNPKFQTLAGLWSWAGRIRSYWLETPEDRFSHDVARVYFRKHYFSCLEIFDMKLPLI